MGELKAEEARKISARPRARAGRARYPQTFLLIGDLFS